MAGISFSVSVSGLTELIGRMKSAPSKMVIYLNDAMNRSLEVLHKGVPPYPPERMGQKYIRTERLGQSLGSGFGGGATGRPDIYEVKMSGNAVEGSFGSRLGYADYVIGDNQAWMHSGRWWRMIELLNKSTKAIESIWQAVGERVRAYLDGGG